MLHEHIMQSVVGFTAATAATTTLWLANATDLVPGWAQGGAYLGLVGGLSFGCVTLWKALQEHRKEAAEAIEHRETRAAEERMEFIRTKDALELEIRNDWKDQNQKLIAVLDRLDQKTRQ